MGIYLDYVRYNNGGEGPQTVDLTTVDGNDDDWVVTIPVTSNNAGLFFNFDEVDINPVTGEAEYNEDVTGFSISPDTTGNAESNGELTYATAIQDGNFTVIIVASTMDIGDSLVITVSGTDPADTDTVTIVIGNEFSVTCFSHGTLIATPSGEREVQRLRPGDPVLTEDGRVVPVKWVGRQILHKLLVPEERLTPIRVSAGALGPGVPHRDLVLTAEHALVFDGFAVNAGALVNGTTVTTEPVEHLPYRTVYYHVETENHEVILANGAPVETFVDYVPRKVFDNYQEYIDLYGDERVIREMPLTRISAARLVPHAIRARLAPKAVA